MNSYLNAEKFDIFKVAAASPHVSISNPKANLNSICKLLESPSLKAAHFIVFPELSISGYTCGDLFFQDSLLEASRKTLKELADFMLNDDRFIVVGAPIMWEGRLFNCAVAICKGEILGVVPKINIPNYQEFYEKRYFQSGSNTKNETISLNEHNVPFGCNLLFMHKGVKVGIEICEDLWVPTPPSSFLAQAGAELILNLSATDETIGKNSYLRQLIASQSGKCRCAYAYASAGQGESSSDLVFSGNSIIAVDGSIVTSSRRFSLDETSCTAYVDFEKLRNDRRKCSSFFMADSSETSATGCVVVETTVEKNGESSSDDLNVDPTPFLPGNERTREDTCREILNIQCWGLAQRLSAINAKNIVVGISGGLDSTLALLVAHRTFAMRNLDPKGIIGITMPAKATSTRTYNNALGLMETLGITHLEIPISKAVNLHFKDIGHDPEVHNAVYENSQARERTQILMDLANKYDAIVLGTGDLSELALGWCTYNGDHMSMYNVNAGVPKTLVKHLVRFFAETGDSTTLRNILNDIIETPISPELIPAKNDNEIHQQTELLIGPYELHDFFLYYVLRHGFSPEKIYFLANKAFEDKYEPETLKKWLVNFYRRFFRQQFKRSCMPDGPKIGSVCLSPRGDWRMPSDACAQLWIEKAQNISAN